LRLAAKEEWAASEESEKRGEGEPGGREKLHQNLREKIPIVTS
jgi:hypothetical protein